MSFFKKYSNFHKGYFIIFTALNIIIFLASIYGATSNKEKIQLISIIALISTITGMLSSIYTARGELGAFTWGVVNTFTYIFVAWHSKIYGQAILYIFFETPMQIVGYYMWRKSLKNTQGDKVKPRVLSAKQWAIIGVIFMIVWSAYAIFINYLPELFNDVLGMNIAKDPLYIVDSLSTTVTITAVILTCMRFVEQWYLWIISATIGIILFVMSLFVSKFSLNSLSAMVMWMEFLSNSIYGFIIWRKMQKETIDMETLNITELVS